MFKKKGRLFLPEESGHERFNVPTDLSIKLAMNGKWRRRGKDDDGIFYVSRQAFDINGRSPFEKFIKLAFLYTGLA